MKILLRLLVLFFVTVLVSQYSISIKAESSYAEKRQQRMKDISKNMKSDAYKGEVAKASRKQLKKMYKNMCKNHEPTQCIASVSGKQCKEFFNEVVDSCVNADTIKRSSVDKKAFKACSENIFQKYGVTQESVKQCN